MAASTTPNPHPLAALLSQHPEECAAVVAVLCVSADEPASVQNVTFYLRHQTNMAPFYGMVEPILLAMGKAGLATVSAHEWGPGNWFVLVAADRYAIARQGAAAWLRGRVGVGPREARYVDRDALAARVAEVLGCRVGDVEFEWRSSQLDSIYIGGEGLDASEIAALIKAGFEPSALGWDVPGDCGEEQAK